MGHREALQARSGGPEGPPSVGRPAPESPWNSAGRECEHCMPACHITQAIPVRQSHSPDSDTERGGTILSGVRAANAIGMADSHVRSVQLTPGIPNPGETGRSNRRRGELSSRIRRTCFRMLRLADVRSNGAAVADGTFHPPPAVAVVCLKCEISDTAAFRARRQRTLVGGGNWGWILHGRSSKVSHESPVRRRTIVIPTPGRCQSRFVLI